MRYITTLAIALLSVGAASAADLICTVTPSGVARGTELCNILRVEMRIPLSRWDNDACATEFLRRGLRDYDAATTRSAARLAVANDVRLALKAFDANHWFPIAPALCGDDEIDTEFGETCDDGNNDPGDGCDEMCQSE
jgi:cysteine-rich repeat protein